MINFKLFMRKFVSTFVALATLFTAMVSCKPDSSGPTYQNYYPNMVVTVKSNESGQCYFQLNDSTTLLPTNIKKSPYKNQCRAFANCTKVENVSADAYNYAVDVHMLDSILTKKPVLTAGDENDKKFGTASIEIMESWITCVEDNYLTLATTALWGNAGKAHEVNLLTGVDPEDPYVVELRHNANGDNQYLTKHFAYVAFDLSSLPSTEGEKVKLKVRYKGFNGNSTAEFDYITPSKK